MQNRNGLIVIASDSESQKHKLISDAISLNYATTVISASEMLKNPKQISQTNHVVVLLDVNRESFNETIQLAKNFTKMTKQRVLYYVDPRDTANFKPTAKENALNYITKNSTPHEFELAINHVLLKAEMNRRDLEQRRGRWVDNALMGLYQKTTDRELSLSGIVGIIATTFGLPCCVLKLDKSTKNFSVVAQSGIKQELIESFLQRRQNSLALLDEAQTFMRVTPLERLTQKRPIAFNKTLWEANSGLVTSISRDPEEPLLFCIFSESSREFSEVDRSIYARAALYASAVVSTFDSHKFGGLCNLGDHPPLRETTN